MLERLAHWVVIKCFPRTAENIWQAGFILGVETAEFIPAASKFAKNHPWHKFDPHQGDWSGHA